MPQKKEPDGKNSLVGEFLLALARAPEAVQEAVIVQGLKAMKPFAGSLIDPYPMLSHLKGILDTESQSVDPADTRGNDDSDAA